MMELYDVDVSDWSIVQVGRRFFLVTGEGRTVTGIGDSEVTMYGIVRGITHGLHFEDSLIRSGVLPEDWEDIDD